jgi:hypothetical protein
MFNFFLIVRLPCEESFGSDEVDALVVAEGMRKRRYFNVYFLFFYLPYYLEVFLYLFIALQLAVGGGDVEGEVLAVVLGKDFVVTEDEHPRWSFVMVEVECFDFCWHGEGLSRVPEGVGFGVVAV